MFVFAIIQSLKNLTHTYFTEGFIMKKTVIYKSDLNADYTSEKIKEKDEVSIIDLISRGECSSFEEFKESEEAKNFILKNEEGVDLTFSEFVDVEENQEKILEEAYHLDEFEFDSFPDTLRDRYFFILADLGTWQGRRSSSKICKGLRNAVLTCLTSNSSYSQEEVYLGKYGSLNATVHHHDGTNHFQIFLIKEGCEDSVALKNLEYKLYNQEEYNLPKNILTSNFKKILDY